MWSKKDIMEKNIRVTVLGDGGWGTALALVNLRRGNEVMLWSAFSDYAAVLKEEHENVKFLPGVKLPKDLKITSTLKEAIDFGDVLVLAIPSQYLRNVLFKIKELSYRGKILVSTAKGIEKKTCLRPSEIIASVLGKDLPIVVLSGPSHAEEVARKIPTLTVAASEDPKHAQYVQEHFRDPQFRVYVQKDLVGVEFGGALGRVGRGLDVVAHSAPPLVGGGLPESLAWIFAAPRRAMARISGSVSFCDASWSSR